jgi:hypothetical protein
MLTLEKESPVFETNANLTGIQSFSLIKSAITPGGKRAYVYKRSRKDGGLFGFEVFVPHILKAGHVQKFPNGVTKTMADDTEIYPSKTAFGKTAWFCVNERHAERRFNSLMNITIDMTNTNNPISPEDVSTETPVQIENDNNNNTTPGRRGRPKGARPVLVMPDGEFSITELAVKNKVEYTTAVVFLKDGEASGIVNRTRTERRNAKGKPTQLFRKV